MINIDRLCLGCMNDNGGERVCPICSYEAGTNNDEYCLPVKFIMRDRYLVGKKIAENGAEITYIGWDKANDTIVNIREYFPSNCAHRNPDKTVSMVNGEEYTFNEGLMEFAEINRFVMNSNALSLMQVIDVFEENGTIYAIENAVSSITLESFLEKNGGTLKWEQARALFLPLLDTAKAMNDAGFIHRAISTDTVLIGRDGKLRLSGYTVRAARMSGSKLEAKLYSGYAAVEQYGFEGMSDGKYTDVYGLCATIFRVLIGVVPPNANVRLQNDAMSIPARFAEELPRHVLSALANGLQVLSNNRTKDIEVLKNELVYGEVQSANQKKTRNVSSVQSKSSPDKDISSKSDKPKKKSSGSKYLVISMLVTALVFIVIAFVLWFTLFRGGPSDKNASSSSSKQSSVEAPVVESIGTVDSGAEVTAVEYPVDSFTGKSFLQVTEDKKYEMFDFVVVSKTYSKVEKGKICSQSLAAGSKAVRDTKIELVISLGPQEVKIADLKNLSELEAKIELLKQGFLYENIEVLEKYDEDEETGVVLSQEPKYGTAVSTETKVIIYINSYEPKPELEESSTNRGSSED